MGYQGANIGPEMGYYSKALPPSLTVLLCNPSWPRICCVSQISLGFTAGLLAPALSVEEIDGHHHVQVGCLLCVYFLLLIVCF